jgi:hypothetical protein
MMSLSPKKKCNQCQSLKDEAEFYKDRSKKSGYSNTCKHCSDIRTNKWISENRDRVNKHHSEYQKTHPSAKRLSNKEYRKSNPETRRAWENSQRAKFPEKFRARQAVKYALKTGKLIKQPCEVCNSHKSEAHHDDYSKPLDVRWLCRIHHNEHHQRRN